MKKLEIEGLEIDEKDKRILANLEKKLLLIRENDLSKEKREKREEIVKNFLLSNLKVGRHRINDKKIETYVKYIAGYSIIEPLMESDDIEEILINGFENPVMVIHRTLGKCETNIKFESQNELNIFIKKLMVYSGSKKSSPIIDATLPEGPRINLTLPPVSFKKSLVTIRKYFKRLPTIVDLIKNGTLSVEIAALLWVCVEGLGCAPRNILITGGTASGKTTLLNALLHFSRENERIVSIEDTLELDLHYCKDWCRTVVTKEIGMEKLVENSLRLRPNRIVVGEVRGKEAFNLINAMNIGHIGMGTIHADSARDAIKKLTAPPMNVNIEMLTVLDLIIVMGKFYEGERIFRRIKEIVEVGNLVQGKIQLGSICEYNPKLKRTEFHRFPAMTIDRIAELSGLEPREVMNEIRRRESILEYMVINNIHEEEDVIKIIRAYYNNPEDVWEKIKTGLRLNKKVEIKPLEHQIEVLKKNKADAQKLEKLERMLLKLKERLKKI